MKKNLALFFVYTFLLLLLAEINIGILNFNELTAARLKEYYTMNEVSSILDVKKKWSWLSYLIVPVITLLKVSIISQILDIGCFFFGKQIGFKRLFNITIKAEFVFLLVIIFKTFWFYFFQNDYTLEDLQNFYPLSALSIIGYYDLDVWWIYPFQILNLFELLYWVILAYLIGKELNITTDKGLSIVASSYGVSLLIWVVGIMFFTLNAS